MKKVLVLSLLSLAVALHAQDDKARTIETVSQNTIKSHIGFLASDALKGRDTPSPGQEIAAEYIKSRFVEYGVSFVEGMDSYFQEVPMKLSKPASAGSVTLSGNTFILNEDFILMNGENGDLEGTIVFAGYGSNDELKKAKVKGKIVVALCGNGDDQNPRSWFGAAATKRKAAEEMGAIALIELYNSNQIPWNFLVRRLGSEQVSLDGAASKSALSHVWMNRAQDDLGNLKKKKQAGSISISGKSEVKFLTKNVVGYVEGSDPNLKNEAIMYSAHYDHVGIGAPDAEGDSIYNGARDNAVGTVTVLSAAENLAKYPTKRSSLFVLFTGEEKGLLGSKYFANSSPLNLNKVVYCFNSDNGGYNDTSIATIIGLERTTAASMIKEACEAFGLNATDDPAPEQGLFDRSDNVSFAAKGVPAPTFSLGFTAFDAEIGKYYHQPGDEPETLDYDYLEKFFKSYVFSCRLIGNAETTPFWVEGDKYYEAGVELYQKN